MKKLAVAVVVGVGATLFGGSAYAAACAGAVVIGTDGLSGTQTSMGIAPGPGFSDTCTFVADDGVNQVKVPAGAYGVFITDGRGFYALESDDTFVYTVDAHGVVQSVVTQGDDDLHDFTFTHYTATGLVGADTVFSGDFTIDMTGTDDDGLGPVVELDSADVAVRFTTAASIQASLTQISTQQSAMVVHSGATASLLTGSDLSLEGQNEAGVMGGMGSYMFGVRGRFNIAEGISVLGGASLINQGYVGASLQGPQAAVALRYVEPGINTFRLFAEGGADIGGYNATFTRGYADGTNAGVTTASTSTAGIGSLFVRGGVLLEPVAGNELALSGSVRQSFVGIAGFSETMGMSNIFAANVGPQTGRFTTAKATVAWTTDLANDVDLTATASAGVIMAHDPVTASIMFVGNAQGTTTSSAFAEGALRLGWKPTENTTIDGFVQASTGPAIGTHAQAGIGARLQF